MPRLSTMHWTRKQKESQSWAQNLYKLEATQILTRAQNPQNSLKWSVVQDNRALADRFLRSKSHISIHLPFFGIAPKSEACSRLFRKELEAIKESQPDIYQAAVLSCLHLLDDNSARSLILTLQPTVDQARITEDMVTTFLGTIVMARQANSSTCTLAESEAALDLLAVVLFPGMRGDAAFPSITRLLEIVGMTACEELLPLNLVDHVLKTQRYKEALAITLNGMSQHCRWYEAEKLVRGLRKLASLPRVLAMAQDIFPDFDMWRCWSPRQSRIENWRSFHLGPCRDDLRPILQLEGPDTTGGTAETLGIAKHGKITMRLDGAPFRTLTILDRCIDVGPGAVHLLALYASQEAIPLTDQTYGIVSAAVDTKNDTASKILAAFIDAQPKITANTVGPIFQMNLFAKLIATLTKYENLQRRFIPSADLVRQATTALKSGTLQLRNPSDPSLLVSAIINLVEALLNASRLYSEPDQPPNRLHAMLRSVHANQGAWEIKRKPPPVAYMEWLEDTITKGLVKIPRPILRSSPQGKTPAPKRGKRAVRWADDVASARTRAERDQAQSGPSGSRRPRQQDVAEQKEPEHIPEVEIFRLQLDGEVHPDVALAEQRMRESNPVGDRNVDGWDFKGPSSEKDPAKRRVLIGVNRHQLELKVKTQLQDEAKQQRAMDARGMPRDFPERRGALELLMGLDTPSKVQPIVDDVAVPAWGRVMVMQPEIHAAFGLPLELEVERHWGMEREG